MSNLINYEISIWEDVFDSSAGEFKEQKIMVIGASDLLTQSRALQPFFKRGVNGTNELTFEMYYRYEDTITGESVENPFVKYLTNETKIKLKKDDKWYDFIIKDIQEDSVNKLFKYSATDLHVNELSKNGYGLILDTELGNNIGTVSELGNKIFDGTGWDVESETIPQKTEETLVEIKFNSEFTLKNTVRLDKSSTEDPDGATADLTIPENKSIYIFYSSLKDGMDRFQFIYTTDEIKVNGDRVIQNKNSQYYIDGVTYSEPTQPDLKKYGLKFPGILDGSNFTSSISQEYRGERFVFSKKVLYNTTLGKYVTEYRDNSDNTWHEYTETKYESPILIQNLISNTAFKSTTGWTGQYLTELAKRTNEEGEIIYEAKNGNQVKTRGATRDVITDPDIIEDLLNGEYTEDTKYTPCLRAIFKTWDSILINSGTFDNRKVIKNFSANQKFVLAWKFRDDAEEWYIDEQFGDAWYKRRFVPITSWNFLKNFNVYVGEHQYNVAGNCYITPGNTIINFSEISGTYTSNNEQYYYAIGQVVSNYNKTDNEFLADKYQLFIRPINPGHTNDDYYFMDIVDIQLYEYVPTDTSDSQTTPFLRPDSQPTETKIITEYYYFNPNSDANKNATAADDMDIEKLTEKKSGLKPSYLSGAEKIVTLSVKQSNYFNAAQSLAETAQCWVDFCVEHDDEGNISSKTAKFKNFIGQDNYAGFRYGVNLKGIQRSNNSKNIVTKLIVQENPNEFANNGFCTIARAKSNETGETHIYDFSHYVRQKQLNYGDLWNVLYNISAGRGADIPDNYAEVDEGTEFNIYGYYPRLLRLNQEIDNLSKTLLSHSTSLLQAQADLQVATNGKKKASDEFETAAADFLKLASFEYNKIPSSEKNKVKNSTELTKALETVATYETAYKNFAKQETEAAKTVAEYEALKQSYTSSINTLTEQKEQLYNKFEATYRRFIQEGTWSKPECIDDEVYYLDAKSVAYTSAAPQVSYTISVVSLDGVEGYENFNFQLADRTFMEDEEFFGYDVDGITPYREEVVLTEIGYYLDEPDRTTIKVQNFKNQFQDLFQRITATTQQVNYSSGAWNSASSFVQASSQTQAEFLTNALNNADTVLQNAGDQSVVFDKDGLTITDIESPNQKIRIVGGAILLGGTDENGQETWAIGMTANGINAKTITTGHLNTGEVTIMNGTSPSFRWDAKGITAFDFVTNSGEGIETISYNTNKGVRFDKFGLYGFDGKDGQTWAPSNLDDVKEYSNFGLTWDGLFLKLGTGEYKNYQDSSGELQTLNKAIKHTSNTVLGRTNGLIYNDWTIEGIPYYNENSENGTFTKIFAVGNENGDNENLTIYDDGTLVAKNIKLEGSIEWTDASSPSKVVYATNIHINSSEKDKDHPINGTSYGSINDDADSNGKGWHKNLSSNDSYYATTQNGGKTWQGPILLSGKFVEDIEISYVIDDGGKNPADIKNGWTPTYPSGVIEMGKTLYTRTREKFSDGSYSSYRYSMGGQGASTELVDIYITNSSGEKPNTPKGGSTIPSNWTKDIPEMNGGNPFLFKCSGNKTLNADGSATYAWTDVKLIQIYGKDQKYASQYNTFNELTQNGSQKIMQYDNNGDLYINASFIKTGILEVKDEENESIFSAGVDENGVAIVSIAGWTATKSSLSNYGKNELIIDEKIYKSNSFGMRVDADAIGNALAIGNLSTDDWSQANFRVTGDGKMYAKAGEVAGWTITSDSLYKFITIKEKDDSKTNLYYGITTGGTLSSIGDTQYNICFFSGAEKKNGDGASFWVNNAGEMHCNRAYIGGWSVYENSESDCGLTAHYRESKDGMTTEYDITISNKGIGLDGTHYKNNNNMSDIKIFKTWLDIL